MIVLFLLIRFASSLSIDDTVLILGSSTPNNLTDELSDFHKRVTVTSKDSGALIELLHAYDFKILIDATMQPSWYQLLNTVASTLDTAYLSLSSPSDTSYSRLRFNLHNKASEESRAMSKLIKYLNWNGFIVVGSSNTKNLNIGSLIYENFKLVAQDYIKYEESASETLIHDIVRGMIKSTGIRQIAIIDSDKSFIELESNLKSLNLAKVGYTMISSSMSIYSVNIDGLLTVVESGLENAVSLYNYHRLAILKALNDIKNYIDTFDVSNVQSNTIVEILNYLYPSHTTTTSYSIVNFHNNTKNIIGIIDANVNITNIIYYPGNTTTPTISVSTPITVSIANGTTEIYDAIFFPIFALYYEGARYAVAKSNSNNEIPGFYIDLIPTDCGEFLYDENWYKNCYSKLLNKLGIAYMTGFWYTHAYGSYITLEQLGVTIPQVSPLSQDSSVDNKTAMPYFLKQSVTVSNFLNTCFLFLKAMGWNSINVIGTDDPTFYQQYLQIVQYAELNGFNIVNPLDKRIMPWNYTRADFEQYKSYFQAAKDTRCRIFILPVYDRGSLWEGFYDIGFRRGDFINLGDSATMTYFTGQEEQYLLKRKELLYGSLTLNYKEYNGALGLEVKNVLSETFKDLSCMCLAYDTFSVIKEAFNYVLNRGYDYENPDLLSNAMRNNKFIGCLGTVYYDSQSNSRANSIFTVQQIANNETSQTFYAFDLFYMDFFSTQIMTTANSFEWPLRESTPSNFRDHNPCPFDNYEIIDSNKAKAILYCISAFFFCVSVIGAIFSYRLFKNEIEELMDKKMISFSDMVFLSYFFLEFFQFISMGPDQDPFKYTLSNIQYLSSMEFVLYFNFTFDQYWILVYAILGYASFWLIMLVIIAFRSKVSFQNIFIFHWMQVFLDLILPALGNIGLLPVFSMLMDIYLCDQAIGDDLQDSFLNQDCTTFCYQGEHKKYVIVSSLLTTFYLLATIYCRPLWEKTQYCLNIKTKTAYLSILSIFQVTFVILNKTLKPYDQSIHGYVLSSLVLMLLGITIYTQPYSYKKVNAIQCTTLVLSFWGILTAAIFRNNSTLQVWIFTQFLGFAFIGVIGIIVAAKFPSMLYTDKGKDISALFIFECFKDYEKYIIKSKSLNFLTNSIHSNKDRNLLGHVICTSVHSNRNQLSR
jgi:Receptor family ligand binding region